MENKFQPQDIRSQQSNEKKRIFASYVGSVLFVGWVGGKGGGGGTRREHKKGGNNFNKFFFALDNYKGRLTALLGTTQN